jgi:hypothetical protein
MKKMFICVCAVLLSTQLFAQEETLLSSGERVHHGGFGGPVVKFTTINGEFGTLVGGRGGWLINHTVSLGIGGYGLVNNIKTGGVLHGGDAYLGFGYGGFELEVIVSHNKLVHFTVLGLIGGGSVYSRQKNHWGWDPDNGYNHTAIFVGEPGANLELNVTTFFRINAGISYRFVSGSDFASITDSDLSGLSGVLTLKFGSF